MKSEHNIPPAAMDLAKSGQITEAIKLTREQTGLGLKDAKDAVEAYLRNPQSASRFSQPRESPTSFDIPPQAIRSLQEGHLIDAIKHTRAARGLGLKAAKETVEQFLERHPGVRASFKSASSSESKRIARKLVTIVAIFVVLAFAYVFLQSQ